MYLRLQDDQDEVIEMVEYMIDNNRVDLGDWGAVDKSAQWRLLQAGIVKKMKGVTAAIREMYAAVEAEIDENLRLMDVWGPHHILLANGILILSRSGLIAAAAALAGARAEPALTGAQKKAAAIHILRHYRQRNVNLTPPQSLLDLADEQALSEIRYVANSLELTDDGQVVKSSIQVLRTGTWHHPLYGKFTVTPAMLEQIVANFAHHPQPPTKMVVDFEHQSARAGEKAPAAGWVEKLRLQGAKLFAVVEWTKEAADLIRTKAYQFISPQIDLNYRSKDTGKVIGATLLSIALTNRPFIEGMQPVVLSEALSQMLFAEVEGTELDSEQLDTILSEENTHTAEVDMQIEKELRTILNLSDSDDLITAIQAQQKELTDVKKALSDTQIQLTEATNKIAGLEADQLVTKAIAEGKLLPAMADEAKAMALKDQAGFVKALEFAGKVAPSLQILGSDGASGDIKLTEIERQIAERLGVPEADLKQYR